jgi:hypothetical protein
MTGGEATRIRVLANQQANTGASRQAGTRCPPVVGARRSQVLSDGERADST